MRSLIRAHRHDTTFVAVIEPEGGPVSRDSVARVERDFGVATILDADERIAHAVGVYSTPQAVVINPGQVLYFRGNYNTARYCRDERTQFARLALEHALSGAAAFDAPREAIVAYGCPLGSAVARREDAEP
jgi:hypothetical protein